MRRFIDLHLKAPAGDVNELEGMLRFAADFGYSGVAVTPDGTNLRLREICLEKGLELISRVDLRPRSSNELKTSLRRVRRRFEVVAVECRTKTVARQAAKDHRVDLLGFSPSPSIRGTVRFDRQEANLASGSNCAYEVNASDIFNLTPSACAKLLSTIRWEIENARRHGVSVVISSGADSRLLMREPRGLASLLDLVGVSEEEGLDMISTIPWEIVESNRLKLSPMFVAPGVRVVDGDAR